MAGVIGKNSLRQITFIGDLIITGLAVIGQNPRRTRPRASQRDLISWIRQHAALMMNLTAVSKRDAEGNLPGLRLGLRSDGQRTLLRNLQGWLGSAFQSHRNFR